MPVRVAVGVIVNAGGEVLVARRADHLHQGGLLEFPGGKIDHDETAYGALCRELREELAIDVLRAEPLLTIDHAYADKTVVLEVWRVERYRGEPRGCQGQPLYWLAVADLDQREFPAANAAIIAALRTG